MVKKVAAIISVLLFLTTALAFAYSISYKNSALTAWSDQSYGNGLWLNKNNGYVSGFKIIDRYYGYLAGFSEDVTGSKYFLTLRVLDDVKNTTAEVNIPRIINSDVIQLTEEEIVNKIVETSGVVVSIVTDLKTSEEYLDFISFIAPQE